MMDQFSQSIVLPSDNINDILHKLCYANEKEIFVNYYIFKQIASASTYDAILTHMLNVIKETSSIYSTAVIHLYLKHLTIGDLDKHKPFMIHAISRLSIELPNTLDVCYCYKTPFVFSQIFTILCGFIDQETRNKIKIVKTNKEKEQPNLINR